LLLQHPFPATGFVTVDVLLQGKTGFVTVKTGFVTKPVLTATSLLSKQVLLL